MKPPTVTDAGIERVVSVLLRTGVLIAGLVVLAGGVTFLADHARDPVDYRHFGSEPGIDRILPQIVRGAFALRARSIIQFGILLLVATPIARVAVSLVAFVFERDRLYVLITALVLTILLISLFTGIASG